MTARSNKYRAKPERVGGVYFASQKEKRRFLELQLLERGGVVRNLRPHPSFPLFVIRPENGEVIEVGTYTADSAYDLEVHGVWMPIVEDVKGGPATRTTSYRLRKRIVEALYGIRITEV